MEVGLRTYVEVLMVHVIGMTGFGCVIISSNENHSNATFNVFVIASKLFPSVIQHSQWPPEFGARILYPLDLHFLWHLYSFVSHYSCHLCHCA